MAYMFIKGIAKWAQTKKPDKDYNNYTIDLYVQEAEDKAIQDAGIQLKRRENEEGVYYKFRRDHDGMMKGEPIVWGPPKVVLATGNTLENGVAEVVDFDGNVGNGSEVVLKTEVYSGKKGVGTRWTGLRVDKLVPYEPDGEREPTAEYPF